MALTKVTGQVIKNTTDVTVGVLTVTNTLAVGGTVSVGGTLTYEDVTNVDSVGLITARNGIVVGSGITLNSHGDAFFTGVTTATTFVSGSSLITGDLTLGDKIIHDGDSNTALRFPAADTITAETSGTERARIDSSGRLLLGTTTPGDSTADDLTIATSGSTGITIRTGTSNQGNIYFADGTSSTSQYSGLISYNHGTNHMFFGTNDGTERLRITSAGLVGINESSPDQALHVKGTGGDTVPVRVESTGITARIGFQASGTANSYNVACGAAAEDFTVHTDNTEKFRITSAGLVGINETPTISQFQVKTAQLGGTSGNTQEVLRLHSPDVSNTTSYRFTNYRVSDGTSHSSSELRFRRHVDVTDMGYFGLGDGYASIGYGTAEKVRITSAGKVGISTASPDARLHVLSGNEAAILIEDNDNGNNSPYLEIIAKRTDSNTHQSFSGQVFLSRNRTEQKISSGLKLGTILFGGNHTNASKSNIAFPASIAGISTGNFDDVNNMPTALTFYTGFTGRARLASNVSSGVERMRISPEGYITKPYQPACTAHQMASAINTNGEANYTEVVFTQTITNRGSHYNTSNGRFTCPVSGVYHVSAGFLTRKGSATNAYHNAFIYKNGSNTGLKTRDINNANELHITVAGLIDCNAGQYLSVYVSNDGGDFWSDYNYFSVHLVG